jgi:hypothetical protein
VTRVSQLFDKTAAGFAFYRGYISLVYGLIATEGLGQLGTIDEGMKWQFHVPSHPLLFLGVFVIGLHFWFICSTVDDSSHDFYRALAGDKWAHMFFFADAIVATGFAWFVMAMFHGVSSRHQLFSWFWVAAAASLVYDLYSRVLVGLARGGTRGEDPRAFSGYSTTVKYWLIQDSCFFLGTLLLVALDKLAGDTANPWINRALSVCFLVVCIVVVVLDVQFLSDSPGDAGGAARPPS